MSQKKYIIGLTGNIAVGKSMVRRMLQELGVSTIDGDSLVHVLQRPGTPVYKKIVETFGRFILNPDRTINRARLGSIAFNIPEAMKILESITHPAVIQQLIRVIDKAPSNIIAIEAIKLFESGLAEKCDSVWVVVAPKEQQLSRLVSKRHMSREIAIKRIESQPPQSEKVAKAQVVVDNSAALSKTWVIVQKNFNQIKAEVEPAPAAKPVAVDTGDLEIRRAKRGDLQGMSDVIKSGTKGALILDPPEMMEHLFSKAYLVALDKGEVVGMIGWQTENLIAGIDDFFVKTDGHWPSIGKIMIEKLEEEIASLSCEAGLMFVHNSIVGPARTTLNQSGYEEKPIKKMNRMWREAVKEWHADDTTTFVKQLLERRIMTPI